MSWMRIGMMLLLFGIGGAWRHVQADSPKPPPAPVPPAPPQAETPLPPEQPTEAPPPPPRDFVFPDPDRPWGHPRYLDPERRMSNRWDRFEGYGRRRYPPRYYYDDFSYRFGVPYAGDGYADDLERAYRQGVDDGRHFERFEVQAERGLSAYQEAMRQGQAAFRSRQYVLAARQFLLASRLNQGDPVSRLSAAHAHFAIAHYRTAVNLLRRAWEMEPRVAYLPLDLRGAYGEMGDFQQHLAALRRAAEEHRDDADLWFLLGYVSYFSGDAAAVGSALTHAASLRPDDRSFASLLEAASLSLPESER